MPRCATNELRATSSVMRTLTRHARIMLDHDNEAARFSDSHNKRVVRHDSRVVLEATSYVMVEQ